MRRKRLERRTYHYMVSDELMPEWKGLSPAELRGKIREVVGGKPCADHGRPMHPDFPTEDVERCSCGELGPMVEV